MSSWPVEDIPDPDSLFYRIPVGQLRADRTVAPGNFKENKGSISTDWDKYSSAAQTRTRQGGPERFAVLRMIAGLIREIDGLSLSHEPIQHVVGQTDNRAHSSIYGLEFSSSTVADLGRKLRIRTELYKRFNTWEIPPFAPVD